MSTEEVPKKAVRALRSRLQTVKNHLEPILSRPLSEINAKLSMTERYELQVLLSYSLNTLYYSKIEISYTTEPFKIHFTFSIFKIKWFRSAKARCHERIGKKKKKKKMKRFHLRI